MKPGKSRVACSFVVLLSFMFIPRAAYSGNAPASVCTDYPSGEVVFIGTLTDFTASPLGSPMRFESLEPLTGDSVEAISSTTVLRQPGSLCHGDDPPLIGQRYLVVATRLNTPDVSYGCADLKREADAGADIEYFRLVRSGGTPTEVSGEARITGGPPVEGVRVQLAGTDGQTQLISNAKGRFHALLKPGRYDVTAEFPTGYEYESCGWSSITVEEHRCARLVVCAESKTAESPSGPESATVTTDVSHALIGTQITIHGKFSMHGKIAPAYVELDNHQVVYFKGSWGWGEPFSEMEGKRVAATGTLGFYHAPSGKPTERRTAQLPDYFYFEAHTTLMRLIEQ
jgi:hypothetical protein